jgi:NAD(P)-dependent dehydrogenase (short-subunit alcohol dehydrogenase family)
MLAPDVLKDRRVAVAGDPVAAIAERLRALGATVDELAPPALLSEQDAVAWAAEREPSALVFVAADGFGSGGADGLTNTLGLAWRAARAVATGALIPAAGPGQLVMVAPPPDAGRHAEAARAALENLARTLSVEWARFQITTVTVTPGPATTAAEVAELVGFLLSPAGGYFSGCRFDFGAVALAVS